MTDDVRAYTREGEALAVIRRVANLLIGYRLALRTGAQLHANDFGKDPEDLIEAADVLEAAARAVSPNASEATPSEMNDDDAKRLREMLMELGEFAAGEALAAEQSADSEEHYEKQRLAKQNEIIRWVATQRAAPPSAPLPETSVTGERGVRKTPAGDDVKALLKFADDLDAMANGGPDASRDLILRAASRLAELESAVRETPDALAQRFHETYERLAPDFGYETRKESAKPWSEVPEKNRRLMTAVCAEILQMLCSGRESPNEGQK